MFTVLLRHELSDWQKHCTAFIYVIGKSNSMETWKYSIVLDI